MPPPVLKLMVAPSSASLMLPAMEVAPPLTDVRTAMPMPTMAAVKTTQSTVTAPDSSAKKLVNSFIVMSLSKVSS